LVEPKKAVFRSFAPRFKKITEEKNFKLEELAIRGKEKDLRGEMKKSTIHSI